MMKAHTIIMFKIITDGLVLSLVKLLEWCNSVVSFLICYTHIFLGIPQLLFPLIMMSFTPPFVEVRQSFTNVHIFAELGCFTLSLKTWFLMYGATGLHAV